ncbi:MAG: CBS domain-containing protein [Pirellulaceae bacterium]|nr:CBS domain-containing protein [Pirellulaceae bacterium]
MVDFKQLLDQESVGDLPIREAITVSSGTIIRAAVARMRTAQIGCVVIVDFRGNPMGIFTEQSLLPILVQHVSLDDFTIGDFANYNCVVVKQSDPIRVVWNAIQRNGERFVCVADDDGKLVGLAHRSTLVQHLSTRFPNEAFVGGLGDKPWTQAIRRA